MISERDYLELLHPDDRDGPIAQLYATRYAWKFKLAQAAHHRRTVQAVLEIGVRRGYSAHAILSACPTAKFCGVDWTEGGHGGTGEDDRDFVQELLVTTGAPIILLEDVDTQSIDELPFIPTELFDFAHVDADHTFEGCLHDLELAWAALAPGGTMLVDDFTYIPDVDFACRKFLADQGDVDDYWEHASYRGDIEIVKVRS